MESDKPCGKKTYSKMPCKWLLRSACALAQSDLTFHYQHGAFWSLSLPQMKHIRVLSHCAEILRPIYIVSSVKESRSFLMIRLKSWQKQWILSGHFLIFLLSALGQILISGRKGGNKKTAVVQTWCIKILRSEILNQTTWKIGQDHTSYPVIWFGDKNILKYNCRKRSILNSI